jgi:cytochrome P450
MDDPKAAVDYVKEHKLYQGFYAGFLGTRFICMALDPEAAKFVIKEKNVMKINRLAASAKEREYFGKNMAALDGDDWKRVRGLVNYGFTNNALSGYFPTILELTDKAIQLIPNGSDLELIDFFSRFTLDVLGKTIFNHDFKRLEGENDKYYQAYSSLFISNPWLRHLLNYSWGPYLPIPAFQRHFQSLEILMQLFRDMVQERKGKMDNSILSKIISDGPDKLSDEELYANIWIFFFAGHETTARMLVFALNLLWKYPEIQEKLYEEISREIGTHRNPTEEDFQKTHYLEAFINEVLRLHPPLSVVRSRLAKEDIKYKDMIIPKGSILGIQIQSLHMNPQYWQDPETFNPDRFLPENRKGRHKFLHVPFSLGPRICIGNNFSLMEQRIFLTRLLQKYRVVDPKQNKPFPMDTVFALARKYTCPVSFEKRN